jgi:hypothetical protein
MSERINKQSISAGYRKIQDGSRYNSYFTKPETVDRVIIDDGEVEDTVELMKKVVWRYINDTKQIAQVLKDSTVRNTCENIWTFLHDHIQYRLDKKGVEQLRRPCRSWAERKEGIDCDCFSIFVSSILTNLGIEHSFRITKYNTDFYQHVYVIVPTGKINIIIDCVLSQFDYEKEYSQNKDFTMSLNGINVAVLSGINGDVMDIVEGFDGLGDLTDAENKQFLYEHLVRTRTMIASNPALISNVDYPPAFLKMLDYAIDNWNTPNRNQALENLAKNETELNKINGFDGSEDPELDGLDDLYGFDQELNGKKNGKKGFFKKIGQAVKNGAKGVLKAVVRFNPVTISARNGFLLAMKLNLKKMGSKLKWAYATKEQAAAKGVSVADWQKSSNALAKIEKLFVDKLQGKKSALKNAILKGKAGGLNGIEEETSIEGLGILPAVAIAAAIPVIASALKALVDSGAMKKEEADGLEAEIASKTSEANASASESDMTDTKTGDDKATTAAATTNASTTTTTDSTASTDSSSDTTGASTGGIMGFVKKQPLVAIGGAALGLWGLSKLLGGRKKSSSGMDGVRGKYKKSKKKSAKDKAKGKKTAKNTPKKMKAVTLK